MLAAVLPFEFTQHPFLRTSFKTITNVEVVLYAVAGLAAASVAARGLLARRDASIRSAFRLVRLPFCLLVALLVCSLLSAATAAGSSERVNSIKWTFDTLVGGLLWLAIPSWLAQARERRTGSIVRAIVAGAAVASVVGILEYTFGAGYARSLSWFKPKPTLAGSFLRLSGTFEYANIAAMYFELALPLAVAGMTIAAARRRPRWTVVLAWLAAVVFLFEGIVLTFSRGALLGVASSAAVWVAIAYRSRRYLVLTRRQYRLIAATIALCLGAGGITLASNPLALLRFTSQSDQQWYQASYGGRVPLAMPACRPLTLPVTIHNMSPFVWQSSGANVYNLGYHWLYPSGKVARFENPRTALPRAVPPGSAIQVRARIQAPPRAGRYLLVWDMVQENVTWFSLKSASYTGYPVVVSGAVPGRATCGVQGSRRMPRRREDRSSCLAPSANPAACSCGRLPFVCCGHIRCWE